ncbi:putative membrane protein required for colicin V production [Streptohalobacillus salinus]|uniref:Putative membrane protein required for colicin V production n=1 Tax=Streptohalobacillus salinus TaxID=621096 RepID=A0A2V3WCX3_9BACI|nr:CvpA family protein [Streptohalobacillus salinus]PXW90065.1 putative membrane protein required for colicin V production [Streptohalobacillus salinus]
MVDIILLLLLVLGVLRGLKRGLVLQVFHFISFFVAFFIATSFYQEIAGMLEMWIPYPPLDAEKWAFFGEAFDLESAYYNMIAFVVLFFGVKIILSIIGSMLDFVAELPLLSVINSTLGAVFGFLEMYLVLFIFIFVLSLVPIEQIQSLIDQSGVAQFMIEKTPLFSNRIMNLWFS